jgi:hypothetical protein
MASYSFENRDLQRIHEDLRMIAKAIVALGMGPDDRFEGLDRSEFLGTVLDEVESDSQA